MSDWVIWVLRGFVLVLAWRTWVLRSRLDKANRTLAEAESLLGVVSDHVTHSWASAGTRDDAERWAATKDSLQVVHSLCRYRLPPEALLVSNVARPLVEKAGLL